VRLQALCNTNRSIAVLRQGLCRRSEERWLNVHYKEYKGVSHKFFGMGAAVPKAKDASKLAADNLKKAFQAKRT